MSEITIETPEEKTEVETPAAAIVEAVTTAETAAKDEGVTIGILCAQVAELQKEKDELFKLANENKNGIDGLRENLNSAYDRINQMENKIVENTPIEVTPESIETLPEPVAVVETPPIEEIEIVEPKSEEKKEDKPKKRFFI